MNGYETADWIRVHLPDAQKENQKSRLKHRFYAGLLQFVTAYVVPTGIEPASKV